MPVYPEHKLGEFFRVKHGYAFKSEHYADEGDLVLLTPGNFHEHGGLKLKGEKEKFYSAGFPNEYLLKRNDLIVAMTDLTQKSPILGAPAWIPQDGRYLHNQRLGKIVDLAEDLLDKKFLFFLLNLDGVRAQIKGSATGATVKHTAPDRICAVFAPIPPVSAQRRIASILSAYDDLIENNTRRIAILEEMARRIYEEWFVRFRFPGHEKLRMVESELGLVPEGWEARTLSDVLENIRQATRPGEHLASRRYVPIDCIAKRSLVLPETRPITEAQSSLVLFERDDILFGAMRPYFHKVAIAPCAGVTRTTCFVLRPRRLQLSAFATMAMFSDSVVAYASAHTQGATIPYAVWDGSLANYKIVIPPDSLLEQFEETVSPMLVWLRQAMFKQENLRTTRDLLLPRLISGELDVSHLPEPLAA